MDSRIWFMKRLFYLLALCVTFLGRTSESKTYQGCFSDSNHQHKPSKTLSSKCGQTSSILFPVTGAIYPDGYYYVTINLGDPPTPHFLDIDTGSHLTWVQCDAPCQKCLPAPHPPYKPVTRELVPWHDPMCEPILYARPRRPHAGNDPCDYFVRYVDRGSSLGVFIKDPFPLKYTNGTEIKPHLAFGCGYYQKHPNPDKRPFVDGILGLGSGVEGIVNQLQKLGAIRNIVGHCFSTQRDGYLFIGDEFIPSTIVWTPRVTTEEFSGRNFLGLAELFVGGLTTGMKDLRIVFDSGSTFTYLVPEAHKAVVTLLNKELEGKQMEDATDETLPICWKGSSPFESIQELKHLFKPIVLSFQNAGNTWFEIDPEAYLVINKDGYACLGILDSNEELFLPDINIVGDVSFLDQVIVYDNENERIGWAPANCKDVPQSSVIQSFS